jgi:glycosyltransferase involved in cell wall biosynthesis
MKVMYVINGLGTGGAERSLAELLTPLRAGGVDPVVVALEPRSGGVEADVRSSGVDVRVLGPPHRLASRIRRVRALIRQERPDIVHTAIFDADVVGRLAAAGTGTTVVSSVVNVVGDPARRADPAVSALRLRAVIAIDGWTARHLTHQLHAVSESVQRDAVRTLRVPPEHVTVVERGRDPARLGLVTDERRASAREGLGLSVGTPLLVAVGRQEYQKGHETLLEAMYLLRDTHPDAVLVIAGREGSVTPMLLERCRSLGLEDTVRLVGHRDDVPDLLAAADVFVLASRYEGLPGALIEAMALGIPAVASDIDSVRAVATAEETALLVPADTPAAFADAIRQLLADPARAAALGARGRSVFERRFTLEASAAGMLAFYQRLLSSRR